MSTMVRRPITVLAFYTRAGCHLCDEGRATLQQVLEARARAGRTPCRVEARTITEDQAWEQRYAETIPVLAVDEQELPLALSAGAIRAFLARTLDAGLV